MRAEESRYDAHRQSLSQAADHPQRLDLVLEREAVPRLYFDGRDPITSELAKALLAEAFQLVFAACSKIPDRRVNSTSATCDLHVVQAGGPVFLLFVSRAAEDRMRMRIDEPRSEYPAPTVD